MTTEELIKLLDEAIECGAQLNILLDEMEICYDISRKDTDALIKSKHDTDALIKRIKENSLL